LFIGSSFFWCQDEVYAIGQRKCINSTQKEKIVLTEAISDNNVVESGVWVHFKGEKVKESEPVKVERSTMTSPAQDANVWRGLMLSLAAGVERTYPDNPEEQQTNMVVFQQALEDGLTPEAKRSLELAYRLQVSLNKAQEGGAKRG
jgi:hypothetical protein